MKNMAYKLFISARDIKKEEALENSSFVVCPFTVTSAITMLYYASEGTQSNYQMEHILQYRHVYDGKADEKFILMAFREAFLSLGKIRQETPVFFDQEEELIQGFQLIFTNKIFIQKDVDTHCNFLENIQRNLKFEVEVLDLKSAEINEDKEKLKIWLKEKLRKDFNIDADSVKVDENFHGPRAILVTGAYYKAAWETKFDPGNTILDTFTLDDGRTKPANFMTIQGKFPFSFDEHNAVKMVEIPYAKNSASLIIYLPTKRNMSLQQVHGKSLYTGLHFGFVYAKKNENN